MPTPVSDFNRRERRTTIIPPPDVFVISKSITINSTDVSNRFISVVINGLSIREGLPTCIISLDNTNGFFLNNDKTDWIFTGGETLTVSIDYSDGTTRLFKGKCNAPLSSSGKGARLSIKATTLPELSYRKIKVQVDGDAVAFVKMLIDTYFSSVMSYSNFNSNLGSETRTITASYNTYGLSIIKDVFERCGWDGYIEPDANDDGVYDLVGFREGESHNDDVAIAFSQTLVGVTDFGKDSDNESNTIIVNGKQVGGASIIRTARNTSHIAQFWRKDLEISDSTVTTEDEATERVEFELIQNIEAEKNGTLRAVGNPNLVPAKTITCESPPDLISGKFAVRRYVHNISTSGWFMDVDIAKRKNRLADLFLERIKKEDQLTEFDNPNGMEFSINLDFDGTTDEENGISSKSNTTITGSKAQISSGTQAIIVSTVKTLSADITSWDMVLKGAEQFELSRIEVSNDGGATYSTATNNQQNTSFTFSSTGRRMRVKVTLNADGSKNQFPSLDGVVARVK